MRRVERRLLSLLYRHSYKYSPDTPFRLSSGRESPHYIDVKATLCEPEGLYLAGQIFYWRIKAIEEVEGISVDAIGGIEIGALHIAQAVTFYSYQHHDPIPWFYVRKKPKTYGLQKPIEGHVSPGGRVVIVDDVVTTGESTLTAIAAAKEAALQIVKIVVLVDRLEGGTESLQATGLPYESIFNLKDFAAYQDTD